MMNKRKSKIVNYASLVKFSHSIFALPFAVTGFFMASHYYAYDYQWHELLYVVLCMVLARNSAMGFNRWADASIDAKNPRTAQREIPAGVIKPRHALIFVIINTLAFFAICFLINPLVFALSPVAILIVLGYSYTKRFTGLSHYVLGLGLAIAPTAAFLVVSAEFRLLPILLSGMVLFWTAGFDIIYSLQDEGFDKAKKLHSIPAKIGRKNALILSAATHFISLVFLFFIGWFYIPNLTYWIGAAGFSLLLIYQHLIVTPKDISRINLAFGTLNGIASIVFAIFCILALTR
ncbi:MAG: putative 4-hydroxybenzoate polyprenyltransferase [Bacteroidales bacterium]|nr:putative 4-hydroxybenzoate polyprenyltransferase [Bacteroidales bacterium]